MAWIKLEKDLLTDPRLLRQAMFVSRSLEITLADDCPAGWEECNGKPLPGVTLVLGALVQIWMIADSHIGENDVLPLGVDEIDEIVGIPGFCELLPDDWLQVLDSDHVKLPGYHEHNGTIAKERAQTQKRVAKSRDKAKRSTVADGNGKALPDQDQDLDKKKKNKSCTAASPPRANGAEPDWLPAFKAAYPKRAGDPNWRGAARAGNARLAEGHTTAQFIEGATRYAAFVDATGKTGTEYVKQAATFLGPAKPFLDPWQPPPSRPVKAKREWGPLPMTVAEREADAKAKGVDFETYERERNERERDDAHH